MNVSWEYWIVLAAFISLMVAATVSLRRFRCLSSILYACSAWLAAIFGAAYMLEPFIAYQSFAPPDGSPTIYYNSVLHEVIRWGMNFSALLVVLASIAYVFSPDRPAYVPRKLRRDEGGG